MRALISALLVVAPVLARADSGPACHGHDLIAELRTNAPTDYAEIAKTARGMAFGQGRLFRLTRHGLADSFLFGTIHLSDPRVSILSPAVRSAMGQAKTVVVEAIESPNPVEDAQTRRAITAAQGAGASPLLDKPDVSKLRQLLARRGLSPNLAERLKPVALAFMLDIPPCASKQGRRGSFIDAQVLNAARTAATPTIGLETLAEQVEIADGLTVSEQTGLLHSILAQAAYADDFVETTVATYQRGDIGLLLAWTTAPHPIPSVPEAATPKAVLDRIITARTLRMRDRLLPLLNKGGTFVAVGVNHIPGPGGLGALLQTAGYAVEKVE